jgi:pantothenate synthetase
VLLAVAGTIGSTRLIDNIVVDTEKKRDIST